MGSYNYVLGLLSVAFLFLAWALSELMGPVGFIVANCANFAFRIVHNFYVIETRRRDLNLQLVSPALGLIPSAKSLAVLLLSAVLCQLSEVLLYQPGVFTAALKHLAVGGGLFLATCVVIFLEEPILKNFVMGKVRRKKVE